MKRLLTLLLFFNTMLLLLQAQPMHQIKGTVIDKNSRQPLEFINVMIIGLNKGSVTNAEGRFTIEQVPPGIIAAAISDSLSFFMDGFRTFFFSIFRQSG